MSTDTLPQDDASDSPPAVTAYLAIGLAAVVAMGVALLQTGADRWAVVPTLIGAAGLAFRWPAAPPVLLAAVAFVVAGPYLAGWRSMRWRPPLGAELALAATVVAYCLAQYRLVGLASGVFPPAPRRPGEAVPPRDGRQVSGREVPAALMAVAATAVGAVFLWELAGEVRVPWNVPPRPWRLGLVVWWVGAVLVLSWCGIAYLAWRRQSAEEAGVYLRDVLWHETRREQRRINRWRAWAVRRLRRN